MKLSSLSNQVCFPAKTSRSCQGLSSSAPPERPGSKRESSKLTASSSSLKYSRDLMGLSRGSGRLRVATSSSGSKSRQAEGIQVEKMHNCLRFTRGVGKGKGRGGRGEEMGGEGF